MPGDYDRDGRIDRAVDRPSTGTWFVRRSFDGSITAAVWGTSGDQPVVGDYDSDGATDFTVFRPATGLWFVQASGGTTRAVPWGQSGDVALFRPGP